MTGTPNSPPASGSPGRAKNGSPARSKTASPLRSKTASPTGPGSTQSEHEDATGQIEVDDEGIGSDGASTIDDRWSSYTASITSSVVDYPTEHGRRYHAFRSGSYWGPNDETEADRLDFLHMMMVKATGEKLFMAPIEEDKIHRILDIGTGTGIWAMLMGEEFPNAEVVGNDLSAIQPTWVPPNVKFEIDDVESPWVNSKKYDFIFCRDMAASLADWPKLMERIYENVNPGGWVEFQDFNLRYTSDDGSYTEQHQTSKWSELFFDACKRINREANPGPKLEDWVRETGDYVNITHQKFKIPVGDWPKDPYYKELGMINLMQILDGLEAFTLRLFTGVLGWTKEEVIVLLADVRRELKSRTFHPYMDFVVYAQKPEAEA
ncbi:methyltransferase domain-containing protein [Colletotrichum tamarilloi]|uniref:Methyltransferase domain-containing protein n=1 Tax=Colletotrichum tamarilloi TaxID=1209934 RepID=A0ABQ9RQ43_9PEZI|nr:methyltransferase domain-containing protein [Colletotrichum tamarilloi]KAI3541838.1 methyltransferase domain-containing protein [Colletotrichum filicis]KAK1509830.1 methyltransferase domain-containing protein [Colletotrichum tamarilloi]